VPRNALVACTDGVRPACNCEDEEEDETLGPSANAQELEGDESLSIESDQLVPNTKPSYGKELLLAELSKMLKKAGDSTSTYASLMSHGLYGTYYCFWTHGSRRCFYGHLHSGSNNFNLLKRGRNVYYRCHGDECSHKPVKKLGVLDDLKASLQDATAEPVEPHDDMHVITQYTRGSRDVQDLLLRIVIEHAAPQAYANLGRLFAYLYMIEGRILATTNDAEKSRESQFFVWNGSSWVQDTSNLVASVFTSQMGCLLAWYERQRKTFLCTLLRKATGLGRLCGGRRSEASQS
jgi:hypothetical protein